MTSLKDAIKAIAKKKPDGFSVELPTLKEVSQGIVVAYLETQDSFDDDGLEKVILHAENHGKVVGGWLNEDNGKYYYDSCKVFTNKDEAIKFGLENKQIAIFDITSCELIKL
jgi:hypothetical protein